jgi:hypothetical protein
VFQDKSDGKPQDSPPQCLSCPDAMLQRHRARNESANCAIAVSSSPGPERDSKALILIAGCRFPAEPGTQPTTASRAVWAGLWESDRQAAVTVLLSEQDSDSVTLRQIQHWPRRFSGSESSDSGGLSERPWQRRHDLSHQLFRPGRPVSRQAGASPGGAAVTQCWHRTRSASGWHCFNLT